MERGDLVERPIADRLQEALEDAAVLDYELRFVFSAHYAYAFAWSESLTVFGFRSFSWLSSVCP